MGPENYLHKNDTNPVESSKTSELSDVTFQIEERRAGVTLYAFNGVGVIIDTTGKNYTELPEILFGPYDFKTGTGSLDQPSIKNSNIDMSYVAQCINEVVRATGIHKFWFYPYDGDARITGDPEKDERMKEQRRKARLKIFADVLPQDAIEQDADGHGYIITV